jgi:hypothetical protein
MGETDTTQLSVMLPQNQATDVRSFLSEETQWTQMIEHPISFHA